jgi:hypothetical protein
MTSTPRGQRWSRRGLMYLIVALQVLILGVIVASQEINRLFDFTPAVDLEIPDAQAQKDPFRGVFIFGQPMLNLDGTGAALPSRQLQPGEKVLVFFAVTPGQRPRITTLERRGWGRAPAFNANQFSIPGTVRRENASSSYSRHGRDLIIWVGSPRVSVELDLPASIPIDDAVMRQLPGPSMVRAALRQGFLGYRYLTDVRLSGRRWTPDIIFAVDEARDRLVVLAPKPVQWDPRRSGDFVPRSEVFVFDGMGNEVRSAEVAGRFIEGAINPSDGTIWALMSTEQWGNVMVQFVQLREDGVILQRGPQIASERIVGFEAGEGTLWVLAGPPPTSPQAPYFVERRTLAGSQGPRLGPFASKPQGVLSLDRQIWVLESDQHRVTRLDRTTGRMEQEYRDVNRPTHIVLDAETLVLIEANQTQLSKFSPDGRALWRIPRFQGLSWILPEKGTGAGWVGAQRFENQEGGVFRFETDGKISRLPVSVTPRMTGEWNRGRLAPDAIRAIGHGRTYIREPQAIAILGADGTLLKRVEGFRYAKEQPLRG